MAQAIIAGMSEEMQAGFAKLMLSFQELGEKVDDLCHRVEYLEETFLCKDCHNVRGDIPPCGCQVIDFAVEVANEKKKAKKLRQRQRRSEKSCGSVSEVGGGVASGVQQESVLMQGSVKITTLDAWKSVEDGEATDMGAVGGDSFKSGSVGSEDFEDV